MSGAGRIGAGIRRRRKRFRRADFDFIEPAPVDSVARSIEGAVEPLYEGDAALWSLARPIPCGHRPRPLEDAGGALPAARGRAVPALWLESEQS